MLHAGADRYPIPTAALDDRIGFVGTSGGGKTYSAGTAVERLLHKRARVVIVDPLGVWWGLRLTRDGKTESPFNVAIFGGQRGDLPLNEHAGALIGETAGTMAESCIIDLTQLGTKSAERRFMTGFLDAIYRKASGEPFHLVVDEADLFAPQKPPKGDETLLGLMEQIVRRGRVKGFIPWLITQRPAVINKNVLSQVDGLIAFKLTSSQDRDALDAWIEGQADRLDAKAIKDSLPTLPVGTGVVWVPGRGILETKAFPLKETFDSSRSPKRGEKVKEAKTLKPLDLGALKNRLASVEADVAANDPARLKAEIARLKHAAASAPTQVLDPEAAQRYAAAGYARGFANGANAAWGALPINLLHQSAKAILEAKFPDCPTAPPLEGNGIHRRAAAAPPREREAPVRRTPRQSEPAAGLAKGERACLIAIAQHDGGVTRAQLTVLTGYKRSSRDTYLQRLGAAALIHTSGDRIHATSDGVEALGGDYDPLPTGLELQKRVLSELPEGERRILEILIGGYPENVSREAISEATNYQRSSRDTYLQRLSARELVVTERGSARASANLFD